MPYQNASTAGHDAVSARLDLRRGRALDPTSSRFAKKRAVVSFASRKGLFIAALGEQSSAPRSPF
jgi:hypothetical protein